MERVAADGTTVLIVSHNLAGIRKLCPRTALLHHGRLLHDGPTEDAVTRYYGLLGESATAPVSAALRVSGLTLEEPAQPVPTGADARFRVEVEATADVPAYVVWVGIGTPGLAPVYTEVMPGGDGIAAGTTLTFDVRVPLPLPEGDYVLQVAIRDPHNRVPFARGGPLPFRVVGRPGVSGLVDLHASFAATP
jgi:hypothetical protein